MVTGIEALKRSQRYNFYVCPDADRNDTAQSSFSASRVLTKRFHRLNLRSSLPTPGELSLRQQWQKNSAKNCRLEMDDCSGCNAKRGLVTRQMSVQPRRARSNLSQTLFQVSGTSHCSKRLEPPKVMLYPPTRRRTSSMSVEPRSASPTRDTNFSFVYDPPLAPTNSRSSSAAAPERWKTRAAAQPSATQERNTAGCGKSQAPTHARDSEGNGRTAASSSPYGDAGMLIRSRPARPNTPGRIYQPVVPRVQSTPGGNVPDIRRTVRTPRPFKTPNFALRFAKGSHSSQHAARAACQMGMRFPFQPQLPPQRPTTTQRRHVHSRGRYPCSASRNDRKPCCVPATNCCRSYLDLGGNCKLVNADVLQQQIHDSTNNWNVLSWLQSVLPNPRIYYGFETDLGENETLDYK